MGMVANAVGDHTTGSGSYRRPTMRSRGEDHRSDHDPSARALAAMAEAAERSRRAGENRGHRPDGAVTSPRPSRRPGWAILALAVAVVAVVVTVMMTSSTTSRTSARPATPTPAHGPSVTLPRTGPSSTIPAPASAPATSTVVTAPPTTTTTTTTTTPATTGPSTQGPVLSSLVPSSGAAGQVLVVLGSGLLSPSGQIVAHFGDQTSVIACPQSTSCLVQVPPGASPSALVTVTTDAGTSNPLTFTYG